MFNQGHQQRLTDDACMIYARKAGLEASWPMEKNTKFRDVNTVPTISCVKKKKNVKIKKTPQSKGKMM